jgi:hypothetical protein
VTDTIPLFVVATMSEATTVLRRLTRAGWRSGDSFALPEQQWDLSHARLVRYGRIAEADTAELALLAAARGVGVVAVADVSTDIGRALLADLERLGPVSTAADGDEPPDAAAAARLLPEQRALLDRLAAGETIAAAAAAEFLSLRTANRRIAEARGILGVRTTREAVLAYLRQRREQ